MRISPVKNSQQRQNGNFFFFFLRTGKGGREGRGDGTLLKQKYYTTLYFSLYLYASIGTGRSTSFINAPLKDLISFFVFLFFLPKKNEQNNDNNIRIPLEKIYRYMRER